ncbi:unnamed protein product [Danaus chrysippus]|uniref:CLIP domain-containing serine protease n=1 Tax=Danaus chrysippus TaxID=151541 RepID=A0A8J2R6K3_9NEOP|nr:unnamed protein product [Danaus chrysippus]
MRSSLPSDATLLHKMSDTCKTPVGQTSHCVSLYKCPQLVTAFEQKPLKNEVVAFLKQSQCGFEDNVPMVCCGGLPDGMLQPKPVKQSTLKINADPVFREDSYLTTPEQCAVDTNGDKIYGGQIAEIDEFPCMALLGYKPATKPKLVYDCGGALINRRYVLTAAHCVVGKIETEVGKLSTVRLGEYDLQADIDCSDGVCADPVQDISVHSVYPHPGFSDQNINRKDDIALIRLAQRATYSHYVQPICLAHNRPLDTTSHFYVVGWGATIGGKSSPVKLTLPLPIFDKTLCVQKYRTLKAELTAGQICAGGHFSKDTCNGDSGGPLARKTESGIWEAVGVVSFGYGCGRDGWPGVYTSVPSYYDWIQETIRATNL